MEQSFSVDELIGFFSLCVNGNVVDRFIIELIICN